MAEKIGLEAVLQLGSFNSAVRQYNQAISGMSKNTASVASSISSSFVNLGSGILKVGAIAGGAGVAGIAALTAGLLLLGSTALTEFAKYERMALSIQSLVARDLSQGKLVEQQRTVAISLTKKETQELEGLAGKIKDEELARQTLHARIKEQSEALRQLRDAHGDEALDVQTATARLAELENQYNKSGAEIQSYRDRQAELSDKTGEYVTVLDKVRTGQMSMTDAMAQAGPKAAELLNWISKLAVQSPFSEEGVNLAFQTALAYGFNVEQAKRLTEAEVDYAAATGKSVDTTNLIALALGQMQAKGKVSGQEIIQLTNAGIGVNKILEDMGFNLDDVSNGLVSSEAFIEAVIKDMEIFDGAAANQANTFSGLVSTLGDLKAIGLREFFTGTFTAIQPYLANFVSMLTSAALETGSIRELGDAFGTYVAAGIQDVVTVVTKLSSAFSKFGVRGAAVSLMGMLGFSQESIGAVSTVIRTITSEISRLQQVFQQFGASGVAFSIGGLLGLDSDTMIMIQQTLTTITASVSDFATQVQGFLSQMGIEELQGALLAIGAIVATGVLAALVAGIASLITPFTLLTAAIVTFSMAWAGNWGNIQGIAQQAITTITTLFTQFTTIWTQNWLIIQAVALTAWEIIKGIFAGFVTALTPIITQLQTQFTQIGATLNQLGIDWQDVFNALLTATKIVAAGIGAAILAIIAVVAGLATGVASGISAAITMFQNLSNNFAGIINGMAEILRGWVTVVTSILEGDWANAWNGFLMVLEGGLTFWSNITDAAINILKGATNIMLSTISGFVEGVIGFFKGMYNQLVGGSIIPDMVNDIVKWFKMLPQKILATLSNLVRMVTKPFEETYEKVKDIFGVEAWFEIGESIITGILEGIKKNQAQVLEMLKSLMGDAIQAAKDAIGYGSPAKEFTPLGESIPQGIAKGIRDATPLAQDALNTLMTGLRVTDKSFIDKFVDDVNIGGALRARNVDRNSALGKGISDALKAGLGGFVTQLQRSPELKDVIGFVEGVANQWGRSLSSVADKVDIPTLYREIKAKFDELWGKLRVENLVNAIGIAQGFAGIGASFGDMVKEQLEAFNKFKEGATKLGEENTKLTGTMTTQQIQVAKLKAELAKLTTGAGANALSIEKITESLAFGERQLAIYQEELAKLAEGSLEWDKKKLAIDKLTESMDMNQKQLEKLTAASDIDIISVQKKQQEIAELTAEIDKNKNALIKNEQALANYRKELGRAISTGNTNLNPWATQEEQLSNDLAMAQLLQEFLDSGIESLRLYGNETEGIFANTGLSGLFTRIYAQEELNKLLAEQAQREQDILNAQKAQKQLDFLSNQINLIKMLSDRGLNPRDILGGIRLGIDASATDLLAATNRVVQAMVNQINADLQIASPSKVMARIGGQVIAGMAMGIERGRTMLTDTVRNIPLLNGSIPQPVFSQQGGVSSSNQNTYNYNFPMTVNTSSSASGVIRQYEVKRSMYAN